MARVIEPISEEELKRITVANLRKEYKKITEFYKRIINLDVIYCPHCGNWKNVDSFYSSTTSPDGIEHYACKECILSQCTDYDKSTKIRTDNKEKTIETFRRLDWYFNEATYLDQLRTLQEGTGEKIRSTAVQQWIVMYKSLPNWRGLKFADSEFANDSEVLERTSNRKPRKEIIKLFGSGFTIDDYLFLQDNYDDWKNRVQIDTKPQETYLVQICFILLDIFKARKNGKDPDKLVKSLNEALQAANWQPRQNVSNISSDTLTFGQLIEKWENEDCIPPIDEDLSDLDNMKTYIDVFFKGHLAKMMGLKNAYSQEYDNYMEQYTVHKPQYDDDDLSDEIYSTLFGKEVE